MLESPVAAHRKIEAGSSGSSSGSSNSNTRRPSQSHTIADPFVFVPITSGEAAKGRSAAKRIVRAHVTRVQHAKSSSLYNLESWTVKPYIHKDSPATKRRRAERKRPEAAEKDVRTAETNRKLAAVPKIIAGGFDPFWTYPVDYMPSLAPIFAHYINSVAVNIPDLDGPNEKGLLRRQWFPLAMTAPSTMYAVLLMAASHLAIVDPAAGARVDLLALKARALSEINAGLADPKRATSDALIGAVAKIAAYEASFGDSDTFTAHMRGLRLLIQMKGGLGTLDDLLERMVLWIDLNGSHLTGKAVTLGEMPTKVAFEAPDPYHFAGIQ